MYPQTSFSPIHAALLQDGGRDGIRHDRPPLPHLLRGVSVTILRTRRGARGSRCRCLRRPLVPESAQTILSEVEAAPALPANTVLVEIAACGVRVWVVWYIRVGQTVVRKLAATLDAARDEHRKDDKREPAERTDNADDYVLAIVTGRAAAARVLATAAARITAARHRARVLLSVDCVRWVDMRGKLTVRRGHLIERGIFRLDLVRKIVNLCAGNVSKPHCKKLVGIIGTRIRLRCINLQRERHDLVRSDAERIRENRREPREDLALRVPAISNEYPIQICIKEHTDECITIKIRTTGKWLRGVDALGQTRGQCRLCRTSIITC